MRSDLDIADRKQDIRETVWTLLERKKVAAFPGPRGRIPNFTGAGEAARRLAETGEWRAAGAIKCNPDSPQRPVRRLALEQGKTVYMAVPRLRDRRCFWKLDPSRIASPAAAATIAGASRYGLPVDPRDLPHIDLIVAGSVAVNRDGVRIGKGGGYSDLEYAIGREVGRIDERTVIVTTVHPFQILDEALPVTAHDFLLDLIITPEETIRVDRRRARQPPGVLRDHLPEHYWKEIPVLRELGF